MERIQAASAMDWSIDLDRGLRSRHLGTRLQAVDAAAPRIRDLAACLALPAAAASAYGVLPSEPRVFAETMLLRLATEFRGADDDSVRARIVRALLSAKCGGWTAAEPEQILRKVASAHGAAAGSPRARALALRMFGCLADLSKDSVHVRSLVFSGLRSSNAAEVKAALFAAGCFCKLSEDFSCITLQVLAGLVTSPTSEAQVIIAAIKTFTKLDCTLAVIHRVRDVGKQMALGRNLEDVFKAEMLFALSRLASKSIVFFGDQVEFLLLFLGHESSIPMKSVALKCLCLMFRRNTLYLPIASTVFGTLLQLIDDEGFPLDCKSYAFRILQKMLCVKAPSVWHIDASELSKLALSAERFLTCSAWEMQESALRILVDIFFCFLKQTKPHQTVSTLGNSSLSYTGYQGISNMLSTHEENSEDEISLHKMLTTIMDHIISLANQLVSTRSKQVESRHTSVSSCELEKYRALFSLMLKFVAGYPSAGSVALDKVRCLMKELAQINVSHYSEVEATCVESFVAPEQFRASDDIGEPATASIEVSGIETDTEKAKLASSEFCSNKEPSVAHDLILCTLKFTNACHDMCHDTSGSSCNLYHSVKALTECVQHNTPQYCSTYEFFRLIMCVCISWNTCKVRDHIGNKGLGDSKEQPEILFTPAWIAHELCALRVAKMLTRKQRYWEAYRSAMYCCRAGLWFTASFVFRKISGAFESGSFSFWFKSLLLFGAGELEMKLLIFPSAISKLVGDLNTGDLDEGLYCIETDVDSTLVGSPELHGYQEKVTIISKRTCSANDVLSSNSSSDCEFFFQRWFISLRASFLEILTDVLGILSTHSSVLKDISHHESRGDPSSVAIENKQVLLALTGCSLRLSDLAKSYDLLAASHGDMDHQSYTTIARLAFMCSLLSFCTVFSVDFSNVPISSEPCRLPERFSHASVLQDLHGRLDKKDSQVVSQLQQFISVSSYEPDSVQFSTRMNCSGNREKDAYLLFKFAVAALLHARADAKGVTTGDDTLSHLHRGMQLLSSILQRFMKLPFVLPKYFFGVRPCLGAELFIFDSNPASKGRISVPPASQLSLTLCLQWKHVLERIRTRMGKLYCILATSPSSRLYIAGTRSKQFEMRSTSEMVGLNSRLLRHIKCDPRKTSDGKSSCSETDLVTAFACFAPNGDGQGFSDCLLDISSFPVGSYQVAWQACCVDESGSYFSLLPLNDGVVFSVQ